MIGAAAGRSAPRRDDGPASGVRRPASGVRRPASGLRRPASGDTARLWASARWPFGWGRRRGGRSAVGVGAVAARQWASARGGLTEEISLHGRNCMEGNRVID
ncbi:hypothetical protein GUJ93_ZPchr0012g19594 [Zizania palustris]|uniref:Uncharacterized protein n=1 Tax=Zizania palustris TaxID=103762 RepID=A0A8J5WTV3_ZIZPA|nr:hypothetical protein GUJ93_ZPchr0012g19594 [Zizania palustris]